MRHIFNTSLIIGILSFAGISNADHHNKILYKDLVAPILSAKCGGCHGEDKQKGKLRLDTIEAIMKGGSEGHTVVAGKVEESSLVGRAKLPLDDDEHMPPEGKDQLTKDELNVLAFWIQSGAKADATIGALKPAGEFAASIKAVVANPPKAMVAKADAPKADPAKLKAAEETIAAIGKSGASLMAIAQNTSDLRFSALNVAKDYGDKNLEALKPVADQVKWMDLARSKVTDGGLAHLGSMKNLTRLHLENTAITDAGLDHLKGLSNLEYLNLYGTKVTDAGLLKLAGLKKLKKLFVWQTKVTDAGAKKVSDAIPGLYVNTGWKEPAKPVVVAAATPPAAPAKPAPKPTTPPKPAPAKPAAVKPAPAATPLAKAVEALKLAVADTQKQSDAAKKAADASKVTVDNANKAVAPAKAALDMANMVAAESKATLDKLKGLAAAAPGQAKAFEASINELQKATTAATTGAATAKTAHDAAVKAAADAAAKLAPAQAAATKAATVATETKASLDQLMKAVATAG